MFKEINPNIKAMNHPQYQYKNDYFHITFSSLGATITEWLVKDKQGVFEAIALSYEDYLDYQTNEKNLGAHIGPYAGRIYPTQIRLNQKTYSLEKNFLSYAHLHSGKYNLKYHLYQAKILDENTLEFQSYIEESKRHLPGDIDIKIRFKIINNTLEQTYEVTTNKDTYTNFTNHTYFNLSGNFKRTIENHTLQIPAHLVGDLDDKWLTKSLVGVSHSGFDFRKAKPLGPVLNALKNNVQKGLDHPFLLEQGTIVLHDPQSHRTLKIQTNQPALVVYSNNFLTDKKLKHHPFDQPFLAICLETQCYPNDMHFMKYPKSFHKAHTVKRQHTRYTFS